MKTKSLISLLTVFFTTLTLQAAVFTDDFTDNDRTTGPAWYLATGASSQLSQSGGVLTLTNAGGSNTYLTSTWAGSTFANVGDVLTLSVTFNYADPGQSIDARDQEMNFGVGNNNGTARTSDSTGDVSDDVGYFMALGGSGSGSNGTAISRDSGGNRWLGSDSDVTDLAVGPSGTGPFAAETNKTFTLTITQAVGGYDFSLSDGTNSFTAFDATPVTSTFNSVTMGWYGRNAANELNIDSVSVDFTAIPEPSSLILMGFAFVAGVFVLRNRRS